MSTNLGLRNYMIDGVSPIKHDKHGPAYSQDEINELVCKLINDENYFERRAKNMVSDTKRAIDTTETTINQFNTVIDKFFLTEERFINHSKKMAGALKDASEKVSQGISRVEKSANFDRLERYVGLLERAAEAMNALAKLEAEGKLNKISEALK